MLFVWTHIYNEITDTYLYDGSDGDEDRLNEYGNVMEQAEKCGKDFRSEYIAYTKQRSAEARQQSAEAIKTIMQQDSIWVKERMTEFYDLYIQNPNNIKQDDLNFMKKSTKEFIADCKKRDIDYRAILLKEV